MKLALCQLAISYLDFETNLSRAKCKIEEAASAHADCILFPEMSFTGFSMKTEITSSYAQETLHAMREMAMHYHIAIGFGWVEKASDHTLAENHYGWMDTDGVLRLNYTKIHPFSYAKEHLYFQGGTQISYFQQQDFSITSVICYDLRFPELFRIAADHGATLVIVPANWPDQRIEHWKVLLQARAIENQLYIVGVNCTGTQEKQSYSGNSMLVAPSGEILCTLTKPNALQIVTLQNDVKTYRNAFPVLQDKKNHLYATLAAAK